MCCNDFNEPTIIPNDSPTSKYRFFILHRQSTFSGTIGSRRCSGGMGCASETRIGYLVRVSVRSDESTAFGSRKWLVDTDKSISVVESHTNPESVGV